MLKIKDNVDLKELEKFGFESGLPMFVNAYFRMTREDENYFLHINIKKRTFNVYKGNAKNLLDLWQGFEEIEMKEEYIQDLIQAGLVEKVSD